MELDTTAVATRRTGVPATPAQDTALRRVAQELEAAFIAEMLKHAGMGEGRNGLGGGGAGEGQFASMLRAEHARLFAERGGIGLAENLFRALASRDASAAVETVPPPIAERRR
ncbi:rod-binding protein [Roseibacterium sp. SDUM158017]|uniref:rod-binding protein n=1 Tax=Roseicyclus salinarum TaxID=3036773 RepID=UPI002414D321|nr:rod-binding protein [Roseibacterium sp. SDUM158017]MDG4649246.1 rod-binding protein [Roseibacterium sp. SDUM158017]